MVSFHRNYQIQTQLCVCLADYADFVIASFSGDFPNLYYERIYPNEEIIGECLNKAQNFFRSVYYLSCWLNGILGRL